MFSYETTVTATFETTASTPVVAANWEPVATTHTSANCKSWNGDSKSLSHEQAVRISVVIYVYFPSADFLTNIICRIPHSFYVFRYFIIILIF